MKLVDTSLWIEFLHPKGDPECRALVAALLEGGEAAWCDMIRLELQRASGTKGSVVLLLLEETLPLLETTRAAWDLACQLASAMRKSGNPVPNTDLLISAVSRCHGLEVVHRDHHFAEIDRVIGG